jgi:hypothetical protein
MASFESSSPAPVPRVPQWQAQYESRRLETDPKALFNESRWLKPPCSLASKY